MSNRSRTDDETDQPTSRLRPETPGQVFRALFVGSIGSFFLSLIALVAYLLAVPEENPTVTIADPPVAAAVGSWVGIAISLLGYGMWSAWQLRTLSSDSDRPISWNPLKMLAYVIAVFIANNEDIDSYDRRVRWTVWAFFGVFVWFLFTAGMLHGSPRGST